MKFSMKMSSIRDMNKPTKNRIKIAAAILIIAAAGFVWWQQSGRFDKLDDFAKCLKDKGTVFYGAFWCPHCQNQKKLFGPSAKYLNYVECSTSDGKDQLQICNKEKIKAYPTWQFQDGSKEEGELTLQQLADKSDCQLP